MLGSSVDHDNCTEMLGNFGSNIAFPIGFSLTGILGNSVALYSLWKRRHDLDLLGRRKVFYVLVTGLLFSDMLGIMITTPPVLTVYATGRWIGGKLLCDAHGYFMVLFGLVTPFIVGIMAVERVLAIRYTYCHVHSCNRIRARFLLFGAWVVASVFSALPFFGIGHFTIQYPCTWCFLNMYPENSSDISYATTFATINILIIVITITCNLIVQGTLLKVRWQWQKFKLRRTEGTHQELETQMVVFLLAASVIFALCWAPFMIRIICNQWNSTSLDPSGDLLAVRVTSFHQLIDPWLYILCRKLIKLHKENSKNGKCSCFFISSHNATSTSHLDNGSSFRKETFAHHVEAASESNKSEQV